MVAGIYKKLTTIFILAVFLLGTTAGAFAAEVSTDNSNIKSGLTIAQAFEMAIANSASVKTADYDIERNKESRGSASELARAVGSYAAVSALVATDIAWGASQKTRSLEEDKLVYSVLSAYIDVLKANESLDYAREAVKSARWQWNIDQISYQQGLMSDYQKTAADLQLKKEQNALELAEIQYTNAYQALNKLLGLAPDARTLPSEKPAYSILKMENVEYAAEKAVADSPAIWSAEQNIILKDALLGMHEWNILGSEPYKAKEIDVAKAKISASNAKDLTKQLVRSLFNGIKRYEEIYLLQQEAIQYAEKLQKVTNLKAEVGMATKAELNTVELDLMNKKMSLNETIYEHEKLKIAIQKPWAYQ